MKGCGFMRLLIYSLMFLLLLVRPARPAEQSLSKAPVIATSQENAPIYGYGDLAGYGVSPELRPGAITKQKNENPKPKLQPKKSWEIQDNMFGAPPPRVPRTPQTDRQFNLPINLIDGNPKTSWVSRGQAQPDV